MSTIPTRALLMESIAKAEAKGDPTMLVKALRAAQDRVLDAEAIGWRAYAQSWREDVALIERAIAGMNMKAAA